MILRSLVLEDYPEVATFWKENYEFSKKDSYDNIEILINKNKGISTLAIDNDTIIGTCLGTFDGRKGYIQKIAVKKGYRKKGIGKKVVMEAIKKLKKAGATDIRVSCDKKLIPFYKSCGFHIHDIIHMRIKT